MANLREVAAAVEKRGKPKLARSTVVLPLPLYGGAYAVRYGLLDADRLADFEADTETAETPDESTELAALLVADACRHVMCDGERLTHDDGRPVRFDEEFAEALGLAPPPGKDKIASMADVVLACWTTQDPDDDARAVNVTALNQFAIRLLNWMQDTSARVEGELVGESQGTRP